MLICLLIFIVDVSPNDHIWHFLVEYESLWGGQAWMSHLHKHLFSTSKCHIYYTLHEHFPPSTFLPWNPCGTNEGYNK